MTGTKEDQDEENTHTRTQICQSSFLAMKKLPHSRHLQQRNHRRRSHPANNDSFLFTFSSDGLVPEAEAIVTLKGTFVFNLFYSNC